MHNRIVAACVAVAAFAALAVIPSLASASPVVTESGARVKATTPDGVNTIIRGSTVGVQVLSTGLGNVNCEKSTIEGELVKNTGTDFTATLTTFDYSGDDPEEAKCTTSISDFAGGKVTAKVEVETPAFCLHSVSGVDHVLIYGEVKTPVGKHCENTSDRTTIGFNLIFTTHTGGSFATCTYQRPVTEPLTASYTTTTGDTLVMTNQKFTKSAGGVLCPNTGEYTGTYTITTTNGTILNIG